MTKIQVLNEKQVDHFVVYLLPDFEKRFTAIKEDLLKKAEEEKDNFVTHAEIIELKKEQAKELEGIKIINKLSKELNKLDGNCRISRPYSSATLTKTDEEIKELIKEHEIDVNKRLMHLSKINLHVDYDCTRKERMKNEIRAQLCMTAVNSFDKIKEAIITNININSFFTTTI